MRLIIASFACWTAAAQLPISWALCGVSDMTIANDIEANVYFLTTAEGGRKSPADSGYRPQFHYNNQDWVASLSFPDTENSRLGETVRTYIGFMSPKEHFGNISIGTEFQIREGAKVFGKGVVTKILELEQSANNAKYSTA